MRLPTIAMLLCAISTAGCLGLTEPPKINTFCDTEAPFRPQPETGPFLYDNDRDTFDKIRSINNYGEIECGWRP